MGTDSVNSLTATPGFSLWIDQRWSDEDTPTARLGAVPRSGCAPWIVTTRPTTEGEPFVDRLLKKAVAALGASLQADTPPIAHARAVLTGLDAHALEGPGLSERTQAMVLTFLSRVTAEDSTFVSIVPDDDGVAVLHWVAGELALQVDVTENGPDYLWVSDPDSGPSRSITGQEAIHNISRRVLSKMASAAQSADPHRVERMRQA